MPRDLGDVLHYFIPEAEPSPGATTIERSRSEAPPFAALPLVAVPIGDRDVVRAAFTWNLCVEIARMGGRSVLVAPSSAAGSPLWPDPGVGPLGAEVVTPRVRSLGELYRAALDVAVDRAAAADPEAGGVVLVRVPPTWLRESSDTTALLRWCLIFSSGEPRDLLETYGLAKLLMTAHGSARVGVTLHGVRRISDARASFEDLSKTAEEHLGRSLTSYGALLDDLHVFRAIVARRPIGLEHPQSPAARALRDVAELILDDASEWLHG